MKKHIDIFLRVVEHYWFNHKLCAVYENILRSEDEQFEATGCRTEDGTVDRMMRAHRNRNSARKAVLKIGRVVATELETAGKDSTSLLLFLHEIDHWGRPETAAPLWPATKVELQRVAMKATAPSDGTPLPPPPPPPKETTDFDDLKEWARDNLKGKQRRVVELVIESGGECPIVDLAIDPAIDWDPPYYDNPFNSIRKALNSKLKKHGWRLDRNDNKACLVRRSKIGQK